MIKPTKRNMLAVLFPAWSFIRWFSRTHERAHKYKDLNLERAHAHRIFFLKFSTRPCPFYTRVNISLTDNISSVRFNLIFINIIPLSQVLFIRENCNYPYNQVLSIDRKLCFSFCDISISYRINCK